MTVLAPGELLTAIRIPSTWAGAQFYFEKVRDRNVWDFPLLNVAAATVYSGETIERIRMVVNAAAARPLRLHAVEAAVVGKPRNEQTAELAGQIADRGGAGAALQRLQDSVDAEPGEAGHQGTIATPSTVIRMPICRQRRAGKLRRYLMDSADSEFWIQRLDHRIGSETWIS